VSHCIVVTGEDGTVSVVGPFRAPYLAEGIWNEVLQPAFGDGVSGQVVMLEPWRRVVKEAKEAAAE
jgi:hypothetical protein